MDKAYDKGYADSEQNKGQCPECGSTNIETKGYEGQNKYGFQEVDWEECNDCSKQF